MHIDIRFMFDFVLEIPSTMCRWYEQHIDQLADLVRAHSFAFAEVLSAQLVARTSVVDLGLILNRHWSNCVSALGLLSQTSSMSCELVRMNSLSDVTWKNVGTNYAIESTN